MKLTSLIEKAEKELVALGKKHLTQISGACQTLGKVLYALQSKAPAGESMSKFILAALGVSRTDVPSVAWSVARCCEYIGEGAGKYAEDDFDATPARWLAVASAIYGLVDKAEAGEQIDAAKAAGYREQVADVIRKREANGMEVLKALRDSLKPEKQTGGGEGEGGEAAEILDEISPAEAALGSLKAAARSLAEAGLDDEQVAVFRRTLLSIGRLLRFKAKTATPAPVAQIAMVGTTLAPVEPQAPAARRRNGGKKIAAAAEQAGTTSMDAVITQAFVEAQLASSAA